jgi:hypothetical protein
MNLLDQPNKLQCYPLRNSVHITHIGHSSPIRSTFASPICQPTFPSTQLTTDHQIYSLNDPSLCLSSPLSSSSSSHSDRRLRFNSHFESGNLDSVYEIGLHIYHLILESDHNSKCNCQWFYFEVSNVHQKIVYTLILSGFHKSQKVYSNGSKVFWYSVKQSEETGISWSRGGRNYSFGMNSESIKGYSLQFQIEFPYDNDIIYISYGLPYTYTDLLSYIRSWKTIAPQILTVSTLCRSFLGKSVPLLTITRESSNPKQVIFLTARCHPGESNGSVVLHGFIDFLLSENSYTRDLLTNFVFRIVPMICVDGVMAGNYRICECGSDLNRMWSNPDEILNPTVWATKELLKEEPPQLYIDFHGHSRMNGTFAYGCPLESREKVFPKLISLLSDTFSFANCSFSIPPERKTASRCVVREELGVAESFCIETSFCGVNNGRFVQILYDEYLWKEVGRKICEAVYHLFTKQYSKLKIFAEKELIIETRKSTKEDGEKYKVGQMKQIIISKPTFNKQGFVISSKKQFGKSSLGLIRWRG